MSQEEQYASVNWELSKDGPESGAGKLLHRATDANTAGAITSAYYERPRDVDGNRVVRGRLAEHIASLPPPQVVNIGNGSATPGVATGGGTPANGNVAVTVRHENPQPGVSVSATSSGDGVGQPTVQRAMMGAS